MVASLASTAPCDLPLPAALHAHYARPSHRQDSKKSPSVSCAQSGNVVATGKYGVIYVDENGQPWDWTLQEQTGNFTKVEASNVFLGTEEGECLIVTIQMPRLPHGRAAGVQAQLGVFCKATDHRSVAAHAHSKSWSACTLGAVRSLLQAAAMCM